MVVYEKARELGELIRLTEESIEKEEAMNEYLNDESAQTKMKEYEKFQQEIQRKMENGQIAEGELKEAAERLRKMGTDLKSHPVAGRYIDATNKYNVLLNQIFSMIQNTATGSKGSLGDCCGKSCGDSCGGCGSEHNNGCECSHN